MAEIEFCPCPDCGDEENWPKFKRYNKYEGGKVVFTTVAAVCPICEWQTDSHANVWNCAEQWNNSGMNRV